MDKKYSIECSSHTYISLYYEDKFINCFDNDMAYMEVIINAIEKRTGMKFNDIPRRTSIDSFNGLRFASGFKKGNEFLS